MALDKWIYIVKLSLFVLGRWDQQQRLIFAEGRHKISKTMKQEFPEGLPRLMT